MTTKLAIVEGLRVGCGRCTHGGSACAAAASISPDSELRACGLLVGRGLLEQNGGSNERLTRERGG